MQPFALYAPPNGTTTGPAMPGRPLWMWAAVGVPIPRTPTNDQQTVPFAAFKCTTASPEPVGDPFGVSAEPLSFAETTGVIEADAAAANTSAVTARVETRIRRCIAPPRVD